MNPINQNPWQPEGVSILPDNFDNLMPIVGQKKLFSKLTTFTREMLDPAGRSLAGFFTIIGGWGVGKSRVGHEVCLEGLREEVEWIVDSEPARILEAGLKQGVLPLFTRYVQITKGPNGENLEYDNWIPCVIVETMARLAGLRERTQKNRYVKNQDQILELARKALRPKGWDAQLPRIKKALENNDLHIAAREVIEILKDLTINHLWIVVDEIEDITDVERDGLTSDDREGIDQALLTIIPRVIKSEEDRQLYPEANFLLLCSMAASDLLKQIRAIDRRTGWHELTTNTFSDVEAFFTYFKTYRSEIFDTVSAYPKGLKEAAFFAANRNFGWFNVIMHHAHQNHRNGKMETPELLKKFAEEASKGHAKTVFNLDTISEFRIESDDDYGDVVRSMFSLFPQSYGIGGDISEEKARRFLTKKDPKNQRALFINIREVNPPQKHRILTHMINCGFENTSGTELTILGEADFDLQTVMESLQAYSICLPESNRDHLLICEKEEDFIDQVKGLTPYPEHADKFAPFLHGLLTDSSYLVTDTLGSQRKYIGPSFSFLLEFNSLNHQKQTEEGFLRDSSRNTRLEEAFIRAQKDNKKRQIILLRGLANAWDIEDAPVSVNPINGLKLASIEITSQRKPLNFSQDKNAAFLYVTGSSETDIEQDLRKLAKNPAKPVVLILEEQEQGIDELRERIERNVPNIAPFVVIHNFTRLMAERLIRLGLMGESYNSDDLRTSHFHSIIGFAREHLDRSLKTWQIDPIERQGFLLRPLFLGGKTSDDEIGIFAKGYAGMLEGKNYHDVTQHSSGILSDDRERDIFKKMVERHTDPPLKYKDDKRMPLFLNEDGEIKAQVPSTILSMVQFCGPVARSVNDIERRFLFDVPEAIKPKEVVRHFATFLVHLGLLGQKGDGLERISVHKLETGVNGAKHWLESEFEVSANTIKSIHHEAGEKLTNVQAKDAKDRLKRAAQKVDSLSLAYIDQPWEELVEESADGMPVYEQQICTSLMTIRRVNKDIKWVYDPEAFSAFRYSSACLKDFDEKGSLPDYPLWKRLLVLKGFYQELDKKRKKMISLIDKTLKNVDDRVPDLDTGEKAFPIQPLTLPLGLYRQELDFGAEKPEKTISGAGTTLGVKTIGFKLAADQYEQAFDRLETIGEELEQPGKLVPSFMVLLEKWEGIREETGALSAEINSLISFFSDAPLSIREQYDIDDIKSDFDDLFHIVEKGGIREGTDGREIAGTPVFQLIDGLKTDLAKISDSPKQILERVEDVNTSIIPTLSEVYRKKYAAKLKALSGIRRVQGKNPPVDPDTRKDTYGKTVEIFENFIKDADTEGQAFFSDAGETSFEIYVGFCQLELGGNHIDWHSSENKAHMNNLIEKKLLTLKLI